MDQNIQKGCQKNSTDGSCDAQSVGYLASISELKGCGGAVKKKTASGTKQKQDHNFPLENVCDSKNSKSKGRNKKIEKTVDASSPRTPKVKRSTERQISSGSSDMYSDLSAKMNSSDNMRNAKQTKRASMPSKCSELQDAEYTPSHKTPKKKGTPVPENKSSKYRSKTPECKSTPLKPQQPRKANSFKKHSKFEPYIPLFQVQQGLKRGEFIEGALRINPRNYEDAYVNSPDGKMDIYIGGMHDRNRALNGDLVVVQINPKQEWKVLCDAIKDYQEKSGEILMDTICTPIPSPPCKIHTPDKLRSRPESSNSWGSACGGRFPDTLKILGVDKLAKQFEDLSVGQKKCSQEQSKRKSKLGQRCKESNSEKTSTSYSQESSEDGLDKMSPKLEHFSHDLTKDSALEKENVTYVSETSENHNGLSNIPAGETEAIYPACDMSEIGTFNLETEQNCITSSTWEGEESLDIIVSPEELLSIDGNSIVGHGVENKLQDNNSGDETGIIIVAPGDLSGDEFTDSASIGSTQSGHLEQVLEDAAFLACQQDADNNNVNLGNCNSGNLINQLNILDFPQLITPDNSITSKDRTLELECKIQHNQTIPSFSSFEVNSESVVCSAVSEISFSKAVSSSDENFNSNPLIIGQFHATDNVANVDHPVVSSNVSKKSKHRKRKKKNHVKDQIVTSTPVTTNQNDISNLTVDEVMKHPEWSKFIQRTGKVVYILERKHSCIAAGHIKLCPDKNPRWALFSPNDSRVPRIMVPMSDCPQNFYHRYYDYSNVLFLAEIVEWNETSTFAAGRLIKCLGNSGDVEVETVGILVENSVDFDDFPEEVLECLPQNEDWHIPKEEILSRRDVRKQCIFTIDPATARDMDDAVSCTVLENGNYEVGVHIADVTYFVREGTMLDKFAKDRSTSVYLVQKVVPMLPRLLCDNLCSLAPGHDRLTFSIFWEMTPESEILKQWIGRSVINSCSKLSYEHAQSMIENPNNLVWDASEFPEIYGGFSLNDIARRVNQLHLLAFNLRNKRFCNGALRLDQKKLKFILDSESGLPSGFDTYVQKESNQLIEEFMLLANMSIAKKLYDTFPHLSLLRRHPTFQQKIMQDIVSMCEAMGIILDASSSGALQNSIAQYMGNDYLSKARTDVLTSLCSKPMNPALYFCTGILEEPSMFHHYALNVPLYTHFTSPIRRYPDILVHRLLGASLNYNSLPNMNPTEMEICAVHCNDKKYNAKKVSEQSSEMFLAAFIREIGSVSAKAMILGVMDHSFDCLILDMGIVKRVYCDKLPLLKKEYKRSHGVSRLNIFWKDPLLKNGLEQALVIFALVDVILTVERDSLQIRTTLKNP